MKVYLVSYGCNQNIGEGEKIKEELEKNGNLIVNGVDEADASIIVTCAVIARTERNMYKKIKELSEKNANVIVSGCLAEVKKDYIIKLGSNIDVVPISQQHKISAIIGDTGKHTVQKRDVVSVTLSINQGCTSTCTYCITKITRGRLISKDLMLLHQEARRYIENGAVEIRLSSQDTSSYGFDRGTYRLHDLIRDLSAIEEKFFIRVGMMSPHSAGATFNELLNSYGSEKVFKFLHLPVQSGSDYILNSMRRGYTRSQYIQMVENYKKKYPDGVLATDVIVGYPGETDKDVEATLDLIEQIKPDIINVTRFSRREGTDAYKLKELPPRIVKERSRLITLKRFSISRKIMENYIGNEVYAIVLEHNKNSSILRDINYRPIVVGKLLPLRYIVKIKITGATPTYLKGKDISI